MKVFQYVAIVGIVSLFAFNIISLHSSKKKVARLSDTVKYLDLSLRKIQSEQLYLASNFNVSNIHRKLTAADSIEVYQLTNGKKSFLYNFYNQNITKKELIIRYTEIGCNACIDSTFKILKKNKQIADNYHVVVLVDFSSYEYYVKWKKVAEVDNDIYWVKKGAFPFDIEKGVASYMFVVDKDKSAEAFFIPNSLYADYIEKYFQILLKST